MAVAEPMNDPAVAAVPTATTWSDAWRRFRKHRMAMVGLVILLILTAVSVGAPLLTHYQPDGINLAQASLPPSARHLLGTDELGRDFLTRLLYAGRISLLIGAFTMLVASTIGTAFGAISGYFGGWIDTVMMRFVELMLAFPALFLLLVLIAYIGGHASVALMVLYLGGFGWMTLARIVRGEFLRLRTMDYVEAARAEGVRPYRIIFRHVLPNAIAPILVYGTFAAAGAMLAEASLDYLGFGLPPGVASWGNMLDNANYYALIQPLWAILPGALITIAVVAINFIGDALRDALDPHRGEF